MQVYKITNLVNGKLYVGQTKYNVKDRWNLHLSDFARGRKAAYPLYLAFRKYGIENFSVEVIRDDIQTYDELDYWEMYYIRTLNTMAPNGYNLTAGGSGIHGYHHTDSTRKTISDGVKRSASKIYTEERNRKISNALSGRQISAEHRQKLSIAARARVGEKNSFYGKHHSDELRMAQSLNRSKRYLQIDKVTGAVINQFDRVLDAAEYIQSLHITTATVTSISHGIRMCCENRYNSSYGYKWIAIDK